MKGQLYMIRIINEDKMISFNGEISPKYGWCVIMGGGSGSGKGNVIKNVLGIKAKIFDVDAIKELYAKVVNDDRYELSRRAQKKDFDFKNPEDVSYLHMATKKYGKEQRQYFRRGRSDDAKRLPNIIFDITAKEREDFDNIVDLIGDMGYKICFVWVVTNREEAMVRNLMRDRVVSDEIFHKIHNQVNDFLPRFLTSEGGNYFDEAWVVFNSNITPGGTASELKYQNDNKAIRLKKRGSAFVFDTETVARLIATLGPNEATPENPTTYYTQKQAKDKLRGLGIDKYNPVRPYRYDGGFRNY